MDIEVTKQVVGVGEDLPAKLAAKLEECPNVSRAFLAAGQTPNYAYGVAKGNHRRVSLKVIQTFCDALGCTPADLGVVFEPEPQTPRPISEAPVGEDVLCCRNVDGQWKFCGIWFFAQGGDHYPDGWYRERVRDLPDDVWWVVEDQIPPLDKWVSMDAPDGWLPLPVVEVE